MLFSRFDQTTRPQQIFGTSLGPGALQNPPMDASADLQIQNQMPVSTPAAVAAAMPAQQQQKRLFGPLDNIQALR